MLGFGLAFLLYYILACWYPFYWMRSAAQYCEWGCNNYPPIGGVGTSYTVGDRIFYSGGCYDSTDVLCEDSCEADCELCNEQDQCKDLLVDQYEASYTTSSKQTRLAAWTFLGLGELIALIGVILAFLAVQGKFCKAPIFKTAGGALLLLGAGCIALGALIFIAAWHEDIDFEEVFAAQQLIVLVEYWLPASIAIIVGMDVFKQMLNGEKKRMLCLTIPFALGGLFVGAAWAYYVNWDDWDLSLPPGEDFWLGGSGGCMAAGYLILGAMAVARILVFGKYVAVNPLQEPMIKFVIAVLYVIGGLICAIGYWAMVDAIFECDTIYISLTPYQYCLGIHSLIGMNGDSRAMNALSGVYDVPYTSQFKAYYVGYSFFILVMTAVNAYDMGIVDNYKKIRTAQQAASAAS